MSDLQFSGSVRRLRLRPGDTIVIESAKQLGTAYMDQLIREVEAEFPDTKVMMLAGGLRIAAVLRPEDV